MLKRWNFLKTGFYEGIKLVEFVERGMLSQVTAGSILGHFGGKIRRFTNRLLREGLVHVIASDAHFPNGPRSPKLTDGVEAAARAVGEEKARAMVVDTPKAIEVSSKSV